MGTVRPLEFRLNRDSPLAQGLVFAGLGCSKGSTWYKDSSGELRGVPGNHGTLTRMDPPTDWVMTPGEWALDFDGTNEYLLLTDFIAGATTLALAAWVFIDKTSNDNDLWIRGLHGASNPLAIWYDNASTDKWQFLVTDTGGTYSGVKTSSADAIAGAWCHLYWDFIPEQARLFVNGKEDAASPFALTGVDNISATTFGSTLAKFGHGGVDAQSLDGRARDLCAWYRRLSQAEISALADPSNVFLKCGTVPLIQPTRRIWALKAPSGAPPGGNPWYYYATQRAVL